MALQASLILATTAAIVASRILEPKRMSAAITEPHGTLRTTGATLKILLEVHPDDAAIRNKLTFLFQDITSTEITKLQRNLSSNWYDMIQNKRHVIAQSFEQLLGYLSEENVKAVTNTSSYGDARELMRVYIERNFSLHRQRRVKRSWLPIGGTILKTVFGLETVEHSNQAYEKLRLKVSTLAANEVNLQEKIGNLYIAATDIVNNIRTLATKLQDTQDQEQRVILLSERLQNQLVATQYFLNLMEGNQLIILSLNSNYLPQNINLQTIENLIYTYLEQHKNLDFPCEHLGPNKCRKLISVTGHTENRNYWIEVPLLERKQLNLTKIIPVPFHQTSNVSLILDIGINYLALGERAVIRLTDKNIDDQCRKVPEFQMLLCKDLIKHYDITPCERGLLSVPINVIGVCPFKPYTEDLFSVKLFVGTFVYTKEQLVGTMACNNAEVNSPIIEKYLGQILIPKQCMFVSHKISLTANTDIVESPVDLTPQVEHFKFNYTQVKVKTNPKIEMKHLEELKQSMNKSLNAVEDNINYSITLHRITYSSAGIVGLVVVVTIVLVIIIFCRWKYKKERKPHDNITRRHSASL